MLDSNLVLVIALVVVAALTAVLARRLRVPHSILLVLVGIAFALVPGAPRVALDPELVLQVLLPPLLYMAGVGMSWGGFRANLRPILMLAVGAVLVTAAAVAAVAHWALGWPWAVGFVLGAVVSPPDAVAPMAIARRLPVPQRILTVLEGEGLVNDATALILFSFAVAAVATGEVSLGRAVGSFAAIVAGELAWGVAIGAAMLQLRRWAADPRVEIVLALATPFAAFWPPEAAGGSGVLATVTAGLYVSRNGPRFILPATRLQGYFVWDLVVFCVESVVFLLTGLEASEVMRALDTAGWVRLLAVGAAASAAVIAVRFLWVFVAIYLPRRLWPRLARHDPAPPWTHAFLVAFTGVRGVVSLAAALSIPVMAAGGPFPQREAILFAAFCVILVTLVGQGAALPAVIRWLGLPDVGARERAVAKQREVAARVAGIDAVLERLDALERAGAPGVALAALRQRHADRRAHYAVAAAHAAHRLAAGHDALRSGAGHDAAVAERSQEQSRAQPRAQSADQAGDGLPAQPLLTELQLDLVRAERARLMALHAQGALDDAARRRVERELDLEEARVRHAAESAGSPAQPGMATISQPPSPPLSKPRTRADRHA